MNYEIISNHDMSQDYESEIFSSIVKKNTGSKYSLNCIQFFWKDFSQNQPTIIHVLISIDAENFTIGEQFIIDSETNSIDPLILILTYKFPYIKIKYISNSVDSGLLNCIISYLEYSDAD